MALFGGSRTDTATTDTGGVMGRASAVLGRFAASAAPARGTTLTKEQIQLIKARTRRGVAAGLQSGDYHRVLPRPGQPLPLASNDGHNPLRTGDAAPTATPTSHDAPRGDAGHSGAHTLRLHQTGLETTPIPRPGATAAEEEQRIATLAAQIEAEPESSQRKLVASLSPGDRAKLEQQWEKLDAAIPDEQERHHARKRHSGILDPLHPQITADDDSRGTDDRSRRHAGHHGPGAGGPRAPGQHGPSFNPDAFT